MNKYLIFIISLFLLVVSCRKDDVKENQIPNTPEVETNYVKDVIGIAETRLGEPITDAIITIAGQSVTTNEEGLFSFKDVKISDFYGNFIKAKHQDYFYGGTRLYANSIERNFVRIVLTKKELTKTFKSSEDALVEISNGSNVKFKANSIADNGIPYIGNVKAYVAYVDPTEEGFMDFAPGDLSAINAENEIGALRSFGMLGVELIGDEGQSLNILSGSQAEMFVAVPTELLNSAPSEIPLWHFDEVSNIWKEEGSAQLSNNGYVGNVSHFSWWNCDDFLDAITLCINITSSLRSGYFEGLKVELYSDIYGVSNGYTNAEGQICGLVPSGEILTATVFDVCGNELYNGDIGPYTDNPSEETINVLINGVFDFEFNGSIQDCSNGTGIPDALVKIQEGNTTHYTLSNSDGEYEAYLLLCDDEIDYSVLAIDIVNGVSGYDAKTGSYGDVQTLDLLLCGESPFIEFNDGQMDHSAFECEVKVKPNETIISSGSLFLAGFEGTSTGTFPLTVAGASNVFTYSDQANITITQFGPVGTIIKGTFEGNNFNNGLPFNGSFAAIRVE